jgi:hypothetical protein
MADVRTTIVVADTSGSMREHGKAMLVRNLLAHVRESAQDATGASWASAPILVRWGSDASVLTVPAHEDLPVLPVGGRAAISPLLTLLDELVTDGGLIRLLVLSDGHLADADVTAFRAWLRRRPNVSVHAIAVGPDAVTAALARLTGASDRHVLETATMGDRGWFRPEEIFSALASWPSSPPTEPPTRIAEIVARGGQP